MSVPAQFSQGGKVSLASKVPVFASLRKNFALGGSDSSGLNSQSVSLSSATASATEQAPEELPQKSQEEQHISPPEDTILEASKAELLKKLYTPPVVSIPPAPQAEVSAAEVSLSEPTSQEVPAVKAPPIQVASVQPPSVSLPPTTVKQPEEFSTEFLNGLLTQDSSQSEEKTAPPVVSAPSPSLNETVPSLAAAVPTAVAQVADSNLNPTHPVGGTVKEVAAPATSEAPQVDVSPGVQYVETEPAAEISPEVEEFLTQVENHQEQLPQEVVIADQSDMGAIVQPIAQPIIILPITPELEKKGAHKNPSFSVRWLVEWSRKMIKTFTGRVVYRTTA